MNTPPSLITWLDAHPSSWFFPVGLILATAMILAIAPWLRGRISFVPQSDWSWALLLLALLVAGRWPSLLIPRELNPDETHLFASAHALTHDPVFWRSVDGITSGPLNYYVPIAAGWLGGWDSYLALRLEALLLLTLSLALVHQCLALLYGPQVARLASLPAAALESLTQASDFLHYSTELLPMVWLAAAGYAALQRWARSGGSRWSFFGGLALGAVPLTKLQAAPLALVAGLCWLAAEWRARKNSSPGYHLGLLTGAVLPLAFFTAQVLIAGDWDDFLVSFIQFNLSYVSSGVSSAAQLLRETRQFAVANDGLLLLWGGGMLLWCILIIRPGPARNARPGLALAALVATAISVACVLQAGRPFLHYWQLVVLPLTFMLGSLLGGQGPETKRLNQQITGICALLFLGALLGYRAAGPVPFGGTLVFFRDHPRTELAARVLAQARPRESIAIWGWSNYVYVETSLRQATRDAHFERAVAQGPFRQYFRQRFLADVTRTRPPLFLDSIGPSSLHSPSPQLAHDRNYPELATLIRANYTLVDTFAGARLYRRNDLVTAP